jgi:hypothetical protein
MPYIFFYKFVLNKPLKKYIFEIKKYFFMDPLFFLVAGINYYFIITNSYIKYSI